MKTRHVALALCTVLAACQHRSASVEQKPTAPVRLTLETRALGSGAYQVTLTARATAALDALELKLDGVVEKFSGLENGATRTISARVELGAETGRELIGAARTFSGQRQMTAATGAWLGVKPPEKPSTIITLPDGEQAEEVRE